MNNQSKITNCELDTTYSYTDSPKLSFNPLVAGLQVFIWLLFHPSAWHNYVKTHMTLHSDFAMQELSKEKFYDHNVRRLLIAGYITGPIITTVLISFTLWFFHVLNNGIGIFIGFALSFGIVAGYSISVVCGVIGQQILIVVGSILYIANTSLLANEIVLAFAVGIICNSLLITSGRVSINIIKNFFARNTTLIRPVSITILESPKRAIAPPNEIFDDSYNVNYNTANLKSDYYLSTNLESLSNNRIHFIDNTKTSDGCTTILGIFLISTLILFNVYYLVWNTVLSFIILGVGVGFACSMLFILVYLSVRRVIDDAPISSFCSALVINGILIALTYLFDEKTPFIWIFIIGTIGTLLGLVQHWWRPVLLYPIMSIWNVGLHRMDQLSLVGDVSYLKWHAAFWDEHQQLHWYGLSDHLCLIASRNPKEVLVAFDYLIKTPQRWAAQAAQIELDARQLEYCVNAEIIRYAHQTLTIGDLQGPASALLRSFSRMSQDVDAALQQESNYNQRLALSTVEDRLNNLVRDLDRSSERYATRFRPIASLWRQAIADHIQTLAETIEQRQEIDSPYVIGVPLNEMQEIFVGRTDIGSRIEQLLLDKRRPPLLIYGQRRMGKTSLLNNLGRLLPSTVVPLYVDLQGTPASASDYGGLLYNIARAMIDAAQRQRQLTLPSLLREQLSLDPFTSFDEWLDKVERSLGENTALLMLDEFEALENAIDKGRFDEEDTLGMLRHLIQHRPKFKLLLAGSHTLEEYHRWASYLINVQVVQVSYLKEDEARQLVEHPVKDFALRYESAVSQRVIDLTRCHPFLVQLLCAEIVALKNEQDPSVRRLATLADVEAAVPEALRSGSFFFVDIEHNQVDDTGRAVLRCMAAEGEGNITPRTLLTQVCPTNLDATLKLLTQRELIQLAGDGYRFQVELIRRWFAQSD